MLASIDLPVETFIVAAHVNILTSLLFLKKKTPEEIKAADLGEQQDYLDRLAVYLRELVHQGRGQCFGFAVEAQAPGEPAPGCRPSGWP